jgi:hypothetical protein
MAPPWWAYLCDCCVGVYGTFRTIPTVESYWAGVFCSRPNPYSCILVKRLPPRLLIFLLFFSPRVPSRIRPLQRGIRSPRGISDFGGTAGGAVLISSSPIAGQPHVE